MVIEITPKSKTELSPFIIIGAVICFILAVLVLGTYFYFDLTIKKMDQEIKEQRVQIKPIETTIRGKENELTPVKEKIDSFGELVSGHQTPLNIFSLLEKYSLPSVWFSSFSFISEQKEINISGHADSLTTVEHQVNALKQEPLLTNLSLFSVSIDDKGGVDFEMKLTFKQELFTPVLTKENSEDEDVN